MTNELCDVDSANNINTSSADVSRPGMGRILNDCLSAEGSQRDEQETFVV